MKSQQFTTILDLRPLSESLEAGQATVLAECPGNAYLIATSGSPVPYAPCGVTIGALLGFDARGEPLVAGRPGAPLLARSVVPLGQADVGRDVVLAYECGDPNRPIVMGLVQVPQSDRNGPSERAADIATHSVEARVDGERLVLTAHKEIVLRCGEASITLTRSGKVLIRGAYLSSSSTGMHRIKGGSVQIN